jgi:hypothetical protein
MGKVASLENRAELRFAIQDSMANDKITRLHAYIWNTKPYEAYLRPAECWQHKIPIQPTPIAVNIFGSSAWAALTTWQKRYASIRKAKATHEKQSKAATKMTSGHK